VLYYNTHIQKLSYNKILIYMTNIINMTNGTSNPHIHWSFRNNEVSVLLEYDTTSTGQQLLFQRSFLLPLSRPKQSKIISPNSRIIWEGKQKWRDTCCTLGVMWPGCKADQSHLSTVMVKNGWSCTSSPLIYIMAACAGPS